MLFLTKQLYYYLEDIIKLKKSIVNVGFSNLNTQEKPNKSDCPKLVLFTPIFLAVF